MKFRIHGTTSNGYEDSIIIDGETIEEIQGKAKEETDKRGWTGLWSEEVN